MKNITLAIDEKTLRSGRKYASRHNMTLNSLVRSLLEKTVGDDSDTWLDECFQMMDKITIAKNVKKWKREDLYRA